MEHKEGAIKKCDRCGGKGRVNGRYEDVWINASWVPTHCEKETQWVDEECKECKGKGHFELKWV
jgi:DnaJ-class molecular chaperone